MRMAIVLWTQHALLWVWCVGVTSYSSLAYACVDAKRVVAFSTAWHVGCLSVLATVAIGTTAMHVVGHALFKAVLFMVVGILLHSSNMQDSRHVPALQRSSMCTCIVVYVLYHSVG